MTFFLSQIDRLFASLGARFWTWFGVLGMLLGYTLINYDYMLAWPSHDVLISKIDPDIYLRLAKIRDFILSGDLYNRTVMAANAPYGGVETPWTHPVDFIVTVINQFMPSDFALEKRLLLSAVWYPFFISTLLIYFMVKAAETGFRSVHKFSLVLIGLIGYGYLSQEISYFTAGNVDHHSLQTLLWAISLWLLMAPATSLRSTAMGVVLGTWIWISPEALPFIFAFYCIWSIENIFKPYRAKFATITSLSVVVMTIVGLLLETPSDKIFTSPAYDTLSIVYVVFFVFCAIGFVVQLYTVRHVTDFKKRLWLSLGAAGLLSTAYLCIYPKFIKGPMADVDPYILSKFLPNIREATHLFVNTPHFIISTLFLPLLALALILIQWRKHPKISILFLLSFAMTIFQIKWSYYLETISIILIAKLLPGYIGHLRKSSHPALRIAINPYVPIIVLCVMTFGLLQTVSQSNATPEALSSRCQATGFYLIQSGQLQKVLGDKLGDKPLIYESNIIANSGIPFFTPYHYVGSNYHREGKFGMQDKYAIFESASLDTIRPILKKRGVNAIMICPMGGNAWPNQYFADTPAPLHSWVKSYKDFDYPATVTSPVKPILLMIKP